MNIVHIHMEQRNLAGIGLICERLHFPTGWTIFETNDGVVDEEQQVIYLVDEHYLRQLR